MKYVWETQLRKNEECKKVVKYSNLSVLEFQKNIQALRVINSGG